jgi:hypothetical protein
MHNAGKGGAAMSYSDWANIRVKRFTMTDIKLIKLSTAAFVLMIAKLWKPILSLDWYWYLVIALVATIKPLVVIFRRQDT